MSKIVIFLSVFAIGYWAIAAPMTGQAQVQATGSQVETVARQSEVTTKDLGVENPGILPSSPFYFLKELARGVRKTFTFNPVKKAELQLQYTNEKAAEIKKMEEITPSSTVAIGKATADYQKNIDELNSQLDQLNLQNPGVDAFLQKVIDSSLQYQQLFDNLKLKFENQAELKKQLDAGAEKISELILKLPDRLESALEDKPQSTSSVNKSQAIEIIDKIKDKLPAEQQQKIEAVRERIMESGVQQQEVNAEDAQNAITYAKSLIDQAESKLANIEDGTQKSVQTLLDNSKTFLDNAEKALAEGKIGEAFGQATAAGSTVKSILRMISPESSTNEKPCTLEAKICPDGSPVGRTGQNCEFAACPASAKTDTQSNPSCGGIRGLACPSGYACQVEGDYPDAGGKCILKTSTKSSQ